MAIRAVIFDVFGSLVDWRSSVAREAEAAFARAGVEADATEFAVAWRGEYQPSMERIRAGGRGYVPLDVLHAENLDIVLERFGIARAFGAPARAELNRAWERLDPWDDAPAGLKALREHALIAPCSNGSVALMVRLARHADFPWDTVVGAETARDYKPKPAVYLASSAALGLAPDEVMMAAAHNDDLAAAREAGLRTAFFPRPHEHGPGQTRDLEPTADWDIVARDVPDLAARIAAQA